MRVIFMGFPPVEASYKRCGRACHEVNAAFAGAFDAGASAVLVNDSRTQQINLLPDLMDPRAELTLGRPKRAGIFCGLEPDYAGVMCIGYHAGASRHEATASRKLPGHGARCCISNFSMASSRVARCASSLGKSGSRPRKPIRATSARS
jgi:D-aminopeptidase